MMRNRFALVLCVPLLGAWLSAGSPAFAQGFDDNDPRPNGLQVAMDASGLRRLEELDPLVGTAIRAAAEQTFAPNGTPTGAFFRVGIQEGTLRNLAEESGYAFRVVVSPGEGGAVKLQGRLTAEGGKAVEFRAHLSSGGGSGKVMIEHDSRNPEPRTLSWSSEPAACPRPGGGNPPTSSDVPS